MTRHVLTKEDGEKGARRRAEGHESRRMRREAEIYLLNRLLAEVAMPEWYPER